MTPQERLQDAEDKYAAWSQDRAGRLLTSKEHAEAMSLRAEVEEAKANVGCVKVGEAIATGNMPRLVSKIDGDLVIRINEGTLSEIIAGYVGHLKDTDHYKLAAVRPDMVHTLAAIMVLRKLVEKS